MTPPVTRIRQDDTHRLIPSRYADETVLARLAEDDRQLRDIFELDGATNERLQGEANLLSGIGVHELLFGVPHATIVNAAFLHPHPLGSRFNGPDRGAWYAAFELETAETEVAFHRAQELREIDWHEPETFSFAEFLADFRTGVHDLRGKPYPRYLDPDSYAESQIFARELLAAGSAGIVYPSVRRKGGICLACFRPALVTNVRKGRTVAIAFRDAYSSPVIRRVTAATRQPKPRQRQTDPNRIS